MRWSTVAVAAVALTRAAVADALLPEQVSVQIGEGHYDVVIFVDGAHVWLPIAPLCAERFCPTPQMTRNNVGYVDLSTQRGSVNYDYDETAGSLKIAVHSEALPVTELRLASLAPPSLEYATAPSLFANYAVDGVYVNGQGASAIGFAETGFSIDHVLAYSAVTATDPGTVVRGLSNITLDRPGSLQRLVVGDDVVIGGLLGGGGVLGGVHLVRDFSLDPYFVAQPTLTQSGVVSTPSTVEIYRDGQLIRREVIPAGPFRIQDLTNSPAADTQVIIRDPFGAPALVMTAQILPPAAALKPGLSQYDYSIGFARQSLSNTSFDYGAPAALFVHRLGITNALTLGGRAEGTYDGTSARGSVGGSAVIAHGRVNLEASAAASESDQGTSAAASLDVGWRLPNATLAGLFRVVGKHYTTIDLGPDDDRATMETGATVGWSPMPNMSMTAQVSYEHRSAGMDRERASFVSGFALTRDIRTTVSAGYSHDNDGTNSVDAMITFSRSLGQRTTGTIGATHDAGGNAMVANIAQSVPFNRGVGFDADVRVGDQSTGHVLVDAEHAYGRATASVDWFGGALRSDVGVAGGLVVIGGDIAPTRPVQSAFALVRVPGAANVRTYLDNHLIGVTGADGDLVVPELQPYYANRLRVDSRDLPIDITTTALERLVGPPRRGGAIIEFAAQHSVLVRGSVHTAGMDLSFGEIIVDGSVNAPVGHDGAFEIEGLGVGHHKAVVEIEDSHCVFELDVSRDASVVELGSVRCKLQ